ncbi:PHP domain-containing protein [bacterium]
MSFKKISILTFIFFSIMYLIPGEHAKIYDITTNLSVNDLFISESFWRILFSPFLDIPDYFLRFGEYRLQIFSWLFWLEFFALLIFLKNKLTKPFKSNPIIFFKTFLVFLALIVYVIFIPYGGNKIESIDKNNVIINFHSHTSYSWDGMASISRSLNYHKANGYDAYCITDHDYVLSDFVNIKTFQKNPKNPVVCFGTEIYDQEGTHHLLFGLPKSINLEKSGRNFNQIKKIVKKNNGLVCAALWWKHEPITKILEKKVDALEISNMGHRTLSKEEFRKTIELTIGKNIPLIGVTDWHGWGYVSYVWTVFKIPGWHDLSYEHKQNEVINSLKGKYPGRVLEYKRLGEIENKFRYIFEPFFGIFYLLTAKKFFGILAWLFWSILFFGIYKFLKQKNKTYLFWFFFSLTCFFLSIIFLIKWIPVSFNNKSLTEVSIYFFVASILNLIAVYFSKPRRNQ